ncbi:MAG: sorbosone dehydrogenase family protein, partial [Novosphingobium meiothermophilum]
MNLLKNILVTLGVIAALLGAWVVWSVRGPAAEFSVEETTGPKPKLAEPDEQTIPTVRTADPIGWKDGEAPVAAAGLQVTRFADRLEHPR